MKYKCLNLAALAVAIFFLFTVHAYGLGYVELDITHAFPSIVVPNGTNKPSVAGDFIGCFDSYTGIILDCPYGYSLIGIDLGSDPDVHFDKPLTQIQIYGGHEHGYITHPFYYAPPATSPLQVFDLLGNYTRLGSQTVTGNTGLQYADIVWYAPQAAGAVWVSIDLGSPPGYTCWPTDYCYTRTVSRFHKTVLVGLLDYADQPTLKHLPPTGNDYIVHRDLNIDGGHGDNNKNNLSSYGTAFTIDEIQRVSAIYHDRSGNRLSINDISLPEGGLFDFHDNWTVPHRDHRLGIAFDINRTDAAGVFIDCNTDLELHKSISKENQRLYKIYPKARIQPLRIVCESNGRIHINVTDPANPLAFRE